MENLEFYEQNPDKLEVYVLDLLVSAMSGEKHTKELLDVVDMKHLLSLTTVNNLAVQLMEDGCTKEGIELHEHVALKRNDDAVLYAVAVYYMNNPSWNLLGKGALYMKQIADKNVVDDDVREAQYYYAIYLRDAGNEQERNRTWKEYMKKSADNGITEAQYEYGVACEDMNYLVMAHNNGYSKATEYINDIRKKRMQNNKCTYCGGDFKGIFKKTCIKCGKEKAY